LWNEHALVLNPNLVAFLIRIICLLDPFCYIHLDYDV